MIDQYESKANVVVLVVSCVLVFHRSIMTTLDDRLLGEKLQNYCSSSEDERGKIFDGKDVHQMY